MSDLLSKKEKKKNLKRLKKRIQISPKTLIH